MTVDNEDIRPSLHSSPFSDKNLASLVKLQNVKLIMSAFKYIAGFPHDGYQGFF